jgi:leucyl-tRNA synthetase
MEYNFREIEKKWQEQWNRDRVYKVPNNSTKPKAYVLDMFPYPSGAGLHVGHPLGYIASDIYARYKRLKGFNVLHPMGFDAFGLPAEQYAIEHGIHPALSTEQNITNFKNQLNNIGFCYDWDREVRTSDPHFYKWTQWIFLKLFNSYFNREKNKAEPITELIKKFEQDPAWSSYDEFKKHEILMDHRLAYCGYGEVNWCEALGTVLANDEVVNGVSERGGYPVVKKKLRQWYLRITEYADRLLEGLDKVEFSESMKEMQANWIGKSYGAEIDFDVKSERSKVKRLRVYTTRPDTIFGVDFMVIAPELDIVQDLKSREQDKAVEEYLDYVKSRSDRERMAEKNITGVFTGSYAINPFNGREIPIWISEYVLAGYGTGAIMAVPCGDERDHKFARHFNIPITNIIGDYYDGEEANPTKDAVLQNSDFLNGIVMRDAIEIVLKKIEEKGIGKRKVNYKMRDAAFSRQRYWGEPIPIRWINGIAQPLDESELPLELPHVENYKPGPEGEGPLANVPEWTAQNLETNTMPGYAG